MEDSCEDRVSERRVNKIRDEIKAVYNAGHYDKALEMSVEFLKNYPNSFLARYSYAVMAGDFSYDLRHSQSEKERLMGIAKRAFSNEMP